MPTLRGLHHQGVAWHQPLLALRSGPHKRHEAICGWLGPNALPESHHLELARHRRGEAERRHERAQLRATEQEEPQQSLYVAAISNGISP